MRHLKHLLLLIFLPGWLAGCIEEEPMPDNVFREENCVVNQSNPTSLADDNAGQEVRWLHQRLMNLCQQGIAFGHQDATSYGIGWKHKGFPSDSDVLKVAGDYPAVMGFDVGKIESSRPANLDKVDFELMKLLIREAHENGSIITISWHADNPISRGSPWDVSPNIADILPGGQNHHVLERYLTNLANFLNSIEDSDGNPIPVIFRPYHEMNGDWFWWGKAALSAEEYKTLFRETVRQLKEVHEVHNVLYCYSPDRCNNMGDYLRYYPGDEWVDVMGVDVYDWNNVQYIIDARTALSVLRLLAKEKNKPFAFTETGLERVSDPKWWTEKLYPVIQGSGAAYVLVWRNAHRGHFFGPYQDHESSEDFRLFAGKPDILLQSDIR